MFLKCHVEVRTVWEAWFSCKPTALIVVLFSFLTEFIEGVSQFSVKGDKEQKLRCK